MMIRRSVEGFEPTAERGDAIKRLGRKAIAVRADVSDAAAVAAMIATIERRLGGIDVLINNAGIAPHRSLDELTEADFDRTIAVNLKSAFLCTQAALPPMIAARAGIGSEPSCFLVS